MSSGWKYLGKIKEFFVPSDPELEEFGAEVPGFKEQINRHGKLSVVAGVGTCIFAVVVGRDWILSNTPEYLFGLLFGIGVGSLLWGLNFIQVSKGLEEISQDDEPLVRIYGEGAEE